MALEVVPGLSVLSMIRMCIPAFVSQSASVRPVGPAPTIRTFVSSMSRLIRQNIFCDIFYPVVAKSFEHFIKGSAFGFSGYDYPCIFQDFCIVLHVIIEFRNGFNGKRFVIVISIDDRSCGDNKIMLDGDFHGGFRCISRLTITMVYSDETKSKYDQE